MDLKNKIIESDVRVPDVQRKKEIVQGDGVALQDYLKFDKDIGVYETPTENDIVEEMKDNSGKYEYEKEDKRVEVPPKFTEK